MRFNLIILINFNKLPDNSYSLPYTSGNKIKGRLDSFKDPDIKVLDITLLDLNYSTNYLSEP